MAHGDRAKSVAFSTEAAANAAIFPFFLYWDLSVTGRRRQPDPVCNANCKATATGTIRLIRQGFELNANVS